MWSHDLIKRCIFSRVTTTKFTLGVQQSRFHAYSHFADQGVWTINHWESSSTSIKLAKWHDIPIELRWTKATWKEISQKFGSHGHQDFVFHRNHSECQTYPTGVSQVHVGDEVCVARLIHQGLCNGQAPQSRWIGGCCGDTVTPRFLGKYGGSRDFFVGQLEVSSLDI